MRTQPRVNEAATEKQVPYKINIKKKKIIATGPPGSP